MDDRVAEKRLDARLASPGLVGRSYEVTEVNPPHDRRRWHYATDSAAALPAVRPENRHPPRNVPSSERYPCMPPPPKPATSPAAYSPGSGFPSGPRTRPDKSVCRPPSVLRVRI